jgi:hypothetical protein
LTAGCANVCDFNCRYEELDDTVQTYHRYFLKKGDDTQETFQ